MDRRFVGNIIVDAGVMQFDPRRVEVAKVENEHEKATLTVRSTTRGTDYYNLAGQRISFTYGTPGLLSTFQGYVAEIGPQQTLQGQQFMVEQEIVCLGPTMAMKGNTPRFVVGSTATEFMRTIVTQNGLGFSDEFSDDSTKWRTLAQTSESDWEMVVVLADRIGANIVHSRGVVRLVDHNDISYRELPTHQFKMQQTPAQADGANAGAITDFTPVNISAADPLYRIPAVAFLQEGKAVYVPSTGRTGPIAQRFATDMPARSTAEASVLQRGYYFPNWSQQGGITVVGDATIEPASVCAISANSSRTVMRPDFDGMWYIKGVRHVMYNNQFYSVLDIGRAANRAPNWYQARPFWLGDKRGIPQLTAAGDGTWLSSWR
jgi:hypothetical protein